MIADHHILHFQTKYVLATVLSGFPIWSNLRKKIQAARIDSVMKIQ